MPQIPLLILSDSIAGSTGLSRIARDLAIRVHADLSYMFRVGAMGVGGPIASSSKFPFFNCSIRQLDQMVPLDLPLVWQDFSGHYGDGRQEDSEDDLRRSGQARKGVLLCIWNASWCHWLAQPQLLPERHPLRAFLLSRPFERWLYCPVDGHLTDGTLGWQLAPVLSGMDRLLAYTGYGAEVMEQTLEKWAGRTNTIGTIPNLPHGLDTSVFYPRNHVLARQTFLSRISNGTRSLPLMDEQILLSCVGTNTPRKDWGLAFATCAELLRRGRHVFLWGHTDRLGGYWNIPALARQYGVQQRVVLTTERLSDENLAWAYSACDAMLGIGAGEGWGLPLSEAMGCGLPVIHGRYAGGTEFCLQELQPEPLGYYQEGQFFIQRPLFDATCWADKVEKVLATSYDRACSLLESRYEWGNCWLKWREWLLAGVTTPKETLAMETA